MMADNLRTVLAIAKAVRTDAEKLELLLPPEEGLRSNTQMVVPRSLIRSTRGYIERVVEQINGTYENGFFDACAVMIRRLIETLIIEVFERHNIAPKITNPRTGDYLYLRDLITATLNETSWSLGRRARGALPNLKDIGDQSAHSRRFLAQRQDIDKLIPELRTVVQELVLLAQLK